MFRPTLVVAQYYATYNSVQGVRTGETPSHHWAWASIGGQ